MTIGWYLSAPVARSREYSVWLELKGRPVMGASEGLDFATTYKVFVVGSMTGVLVIPAPITTAVDMVHNCKSPCIGPASVVHVQVLWYMCRYFGVSYAHKDQM